MAKQDPLAPPPMKRREQIIETWRMTRKADPATLWWVLGTFVIGFVVGAAILYVVGNGGTLGIVLAVVFGVLLGGLLSLIIFGRRAQAAAFKQMDGQPGAAAAALRQLRRGWKTEPAVAVNRQQDLVHRVVGPPGIVLVGEGNHTRVRQLLINERRRHERVLTGTPVHEVICGNEADEVPLTKLVKTVTKLGRSVQPAEMTDILNRLKALDANRSAVPLPKGPVPTSMKGMRGSQRGR